MDDDQAAAEAGLAELIIDAAQRIAADPLALGQTLDDVISRKLRETGVQHAADLDGPFVEPLLQSAWFEALSVHAPSAGTDALLTLTEDLLDAICQTLADATSVH